MSITQICDACGGVIKLDDMITCSNCSSQNDALIRDLEAQIEDLLNEVKELQGLMDASNDKTQA